MGATLTADNSEPRLGDFFIGWPWFLCAGIACLSVIWSRPQQGVPLLVAALAAFPPFFAFAKRRWTRHLIGLARIALAITFLEIATSYAPHVRAGETPMFVYDYKPPHYTLTNLLALDGAGPATTPIFTTQGDKWQIHFYVFCKPHRSPTESELEVYPNGSDLQLLPSSSPRTTARHFDVGGTFFVKIETSCKWFIFVQG